MTQIIMVLVKHKINMEYIMEIEAKEYKRLHKNYFSLRGQINSSLCAVVNRTQVS
jgi:hypothetical protein